MVTVVSMGKGVYEVDLSDGKFKIIRVIYHDITKD